MTFLCRSEYFMQFPAKTIFLNVNPIQPHRGAIGLIDMIVLCRSLHFMQFQARGFTKHPNMSIGKPQRGITKHPSKGLHKASEQEASRNPPVRTCEAPRGFMKHPTKLLCKGLHEAPR